jgi:hypothetical protein
MECAHCGQPLELGTPGEESRVNSFAANFVLTPKYLCQCRSRQLITGKFVAGEKGEGSLGYFRHITIPVAHCNSLRESHRNPNTALLELARGALG